MRSPTADKTGYYDKFGRVICDGDQIHGMIHGQEVHGKVYRGYYNNAWLVKVSGGSWCPNLCSFDNVEVMTFDGRNFSKRFRRELHGDLFS